VRAADEGERHPDLETAAPCARATARTIESPSPWPPWLAVPHGAVGHEPQERLEEPLDLRLGSVPGLGIRVSDVVGIAAAPGGTGYWLVASGGGVFSFVGTPFEGAG